MTDQELEEQMKKAIEVAGLFVSQYEATIIHAPADKVDFEQTILRIEESLLNLRKQIYAANLIKSEGIKMKDIESANWTKNRLIDLGKSVIMAVRVLDEKGI